MTGNTKIATGGGIAILIIAMLFFIFQPGKQKTAQQTTPPAQIETKPVLTSPPNLPTAQPIVPQNMEGTVVSLTGTDLVLSVSGANKNFSLAKTQDFQKVVSGSREGGNMKTGQATIADIKAGGTLYMIIDKTTGNIVSVLVLN